MKRADLLQKLGKFRQNWATRLKNEERIINALPARLDVERVTSPARIENVPEDGGIELRVRTVADLMTLLDKYPLLRPTRLVRTVVERVPGHKTTSFQPQCRTNMKWYTQPGHEVREIYPMLAQLAPSDDPVKPRFFVEWFAELQPNLVVNVRATITEHDVFWQRGYYKQERTPYTYAWPNAPQGDDRRVLYAKKGQPPFVTIWWNDPDGLWPFVSQEQEVAL